MYNKKYFALLCFILIFFWGSFSMTFPNTYDDEIKMSNVQAMAMYTAIFDLYKTTNKSNMNNFKNQFIKEHGDITIVNQKEGIRIYFNMGEPDATDGDITYLIDKENFTIIKREAGM